MIRFALPALLASLLAAAPAPAGAGGALPACDTTDDAANCVRLLACIGGGGRWFSGRAVGRGSGTLAGETDDGVICQGRWTERNALGLGQANVACDDGMTVTVFFYYQDAHTGTAIGRGRASTGATVQSWSGLHVLDYLSERTGRPMPHLPCGAREIPVS